MDKNTLSHYGWVVICIIVIAILLGLATPFGYFVKDSVLNTTDSFGKKIIESLDFGGKIPGTPPGSTIEPTDDVDPDSQQARNLISEDIGDILHRYIYNEANVKKVTFQPSLGSYENYNQVYNYYYLPQDFEQKKVIASTTGTETPNDDTARLEMCSYLYSSAIEMGITFENGEDLLLQALGFSNKAELDAFAAEEGFGDADGLMLEETGFTYSVMVDTLDAIIDGSISPFWTYDKDAFIEAFEGGKIALDITDEEVNENISDEKDAGRVIAYFEGDELIIAGKNGKSIIQDDDDLCNLFNGFNNLLAVDFNNGLNTKQLVEFRDIFSDNKLLKNVELTGLNLSNATNFFEAFANTSITEIDLSEINFASATTVRRMFVNATKLTNIIMPKNGFPAATGSEEMFKDCTSLKMPKLLMPKLEIADRMFENCTSLLNEGAILDFSWLPETIITAEYMFAGCDNITAISGLENRSFPVLTRANNMIPKKVTHLSLRNFSAPNCTWDPYHHLDALIEMDISGMSIGINHIYTNSSKTLKKFIANDLVMPNFTLLQHTFADYSVLETVEISFKECGNITSTIGAFSGCTSLKTIDLRALDLSKATTIFETFENCGAETILLGSLESADFAENLFAGCTSLKNLEIGYIPDVLHSGYGQFTNVKNVELTYGGTKESFESSLIYLRSDDSTFSKIICTDGEYIR